MRAASITRRGGRIIIHPWSRADSGVGLATPPFIVLDADEDPRKIGKAVRDALAAVQVGLPHPKPDEWSKFDKPLYAAAGVTNWSSFVKGAASSEIIEYEMELEFAPWKNLGSRKGFQDAGIESVTIPVGSDESTIGKAALRALELAEAASSAPGNTKTASAKTARPEPDHRISVEDDNGTTHGSTENEKLLAELEELGFFRHANPKHLDRERNAILKQGWSGIFGENGRWFFADAEDLAEGGVAALITELGTFLKRQGVTIPELEDEFDPSEKYTLIAGKERFPIWTQSELAREASGEPGLIWGLSSTRTIQILNLWLERSSSSERAYGVHGGNDFAIYFLTPELYSRISQDREASSRDSPYVPELKYPYFGQPQE